MGDGRQGWFPPPMAWHSIMRSIPAVSMVDEDMFLVFCCQTLSLDAQSDAKHSYRRKDIILTQIMVQTTCQ